MLHQIGAGALGPVFRAYDPENERLVAVKMFRLDLPPDQVHRLEAELEALVASNLTHPSLAQPLRAGRSGVAAYLAEEFVAAESLDIVVRDSGAVPFDEVLRLGTHLASALDLAAAAGVFHGTLHPRDVLLSADAIRLTGIGVAQALERIGQPAPVRRPYSAPERLAGAPWDRRADVFSLATLMHEMLWARRVNGIGPQAAEALTAIDGADLDRLRLTFAQALAEDPANRFGTALEFIDVLRDATSDRHVGLTAGAKAPAPSQELPPPRARAAKAGGRAAEASALLRTSLAIQDPNAMPLFATPVPEPPVSPELPLSPAPPGGIAETAEIDHPLRPPIVAPAGDPESVEVEIERFAEESEPPIVVEPDDTPVVPPPFSRIDDNDDRFDDYRNDTNTEDPASLNLENFENPENPENLEKRADLVSSEALPPYLENRANSEQRESPEPRPTPVIQVRPRAAVLSAPEVTLEPEEEESALSRGFMPLVLALIVGLGIGFAAGYGIGSNAGANQSADLTTGASAPTDVSPGAASRPLAPALNSSAPAAGAAPPADAAATPPVAPSTPAVVPPAVETKPAAPARAAREAAPETGRILVRSTPSNARVVLDGREVGRTPYTAREVSRGSHVVRIVRDGYETAERRVTVSTAEPSRTISVVLARNTPPERAPAAPAAPRPPPAPATASAVTGSLYLESRPSRASVTIDGRLSGTTPMLLDGLAPGDHIVRITTADHRPHTETVKITAGQRTRLQVSLER